MKKLMLGMLMIVSQQILMAQYKLSGTVSEKNGNNLITNATVEIAGNGFTQTDNEGRFSMALRQKGTYTLKVTAIAFKQFEQTVTITQKETTLNIQLEEALYCSEQ